MNKTKLRAAIDRGLAPGGDLHRELRELGKYGVTTRDDAEALCEALIRFPFDQTQQNSPLHEIANLFRFVESQETEAFRVLRDRGIPELLRVFDVVAARGREDDRVDLLFTLVTLAFYKTKEGTQKVIEAARKPLAPEIFTWTFVLDTYKRDHPYVSLLFEALSDPLPPDFLRVALLDAANQIAIAGSKLRHPFDSPEGKERLRAWLSDQDLDNYSYARSATTALPFISSPEREELLAMAAAHPETRVRVEAAWVSAKLGDEAGISLLAELCRDPRYLNDAKAYLDELGRQDAIPTSAHDRDFQAMANMCDWLAHPMEYLAPPDRIELYDTRELYWPPTKDRRRVWLFNYFYVPKEPDGEDIAGVGMTGSMTYAPQDESTFNMPPQDVYALHCCWELQINKDPSAPPEDSVQAGREILAKHNPGGF